MVGNTVGPALGRKVGVADAGIDGSKVGVDDGTPVGVFVGAGVGARVGLIVGASVAGINPSSNIRCSFKMRVFLSVVPRASKSGTTKNCFEIRPQFAGMKVGAGLGTPLFQR